ncbi:MAG TPA: hypothetical protein G4O17_01190 [Dehalococcoidia bacterium]|nr:hypothetical protein [Dehalococcoidia bacterium]
MRTALDSGWIMCLFKDILGGNPDSQLEETEKIIVFTKGYLGKYWRDFAGS